jgi:stage IV sporulation protein FB
MYKNKESFRRMITYLAGPIINFIMVLIFACISLNENLKMKIVYTNLLLAIFNLLPIMPLDGGKILKEIMVKKIGNKDAVIFMNQLTQVILVVITLLYSIAILQMKNFAIFLLILYLWYLKYLEDKKLKSMIRAYEIIEKN